MYYTVYEITNKVNGMVYIGCHKTRNLDDNYMGSGKLIKRAIEKYGIDAFQKEILYVYDNPDDMFAKEAEIVNEEFIAEEHTYNIKVGGSGGFDYVNENYSFERRKQTSIIANSKKREKMDEEPEFREKIIHHALKNLHSVESRRKSLLWRQNNPGTFLGKKHTEKTKTTIGEKNSKHQTGKNNSQYGTMWIYNPLLKQNKKIKKEDPIPDGWFKGRKTTNNW